METQLSLLIGEARKDDGMHRAWHAANPDFKLAAEQAIRHLARTKAQFTSDDVWSLLDGVADTKEHRALGAVMRAVAKEGLISKTDRVVPTTRACANRRPVAVWRSCLALAR